MTYPLSQCCFLCKLNNKTLWNVRFDAGTQVIHYCLLCHPDCSQRTPTIRSRQSENRSHFSVVSGVVDSSGMLQHFDSIKLLRQWCWVSWRGKCISICAYYSHCYLCRYVESLIHSSLQCRFSEEVWLVFIFKNLRFLWECVCESWRRKKSVCLSVWVFIMHCFQLIPVKMQRVILPPALNRSQLVGIATPFQHTHTHTLHVFVFVNVLDNHGSVCESSVCSDQSEPCPPPLPPLPCQFRRNMMFQALWEERRYVTLSYWTHSFSDSPARPDGLFHKRFMSRVMCVPKM